MGQGDVKEPDRSQNGRTAGAVFLLVPPISIGLPAPLILLVPHVPLVPPQLTIKMRSCKSPDWPVRTILAGREVPGSSRQVKCHHHQAQAPLVVATAAG